MTDAFSQHLVAVDIGNRRMKVGLFPTSHDAALPEPLRTLRIDSSNVTFDSLIDWLPPERLTWCVATVHRGAERRLAEQVREHRGDDQYLLLTNDRVPIDIRVEHPERVGTDRLLAAVAVNRLRRTGCPAIIMDAGSAITVDLVSADGAFEGGAILPGFEMVAGALADQTDQLPMVEYSLEHEPPCVVGKSTAAAIQSGLFWGTVGAVQELSRRMSSEMGDQTQLFVAGGDAARLAPFLSDSAQTVSELVLQGIVLSYHHLRKHSSF